MNFKRYLQERKRVKRPLIVPDNSNEVDLEYTLHDLIDIVTLLCEHPRSRISFSVDKDIAAITVHDSKINPMRECCDKYLVNNPCSHWGFCPECCPMCNHYCMLSCPHCQELGWVPRYQECVLCHFSK